MDDIYQALSACIQNHCVSKEELLDALELKVNKEDLEVLLLQKANKQSVANALQRKANKQDIVTLDEKVGLLSLSISEMHHAQPNLTDIYTRLEECKALCDRQKENFVEVMRQDIGSMKEEVEG